MCQTPFWVLETQQRTIQLSASSHADYILGIVGGGIDNKEIYK